MTEATLWTDLFFSPGVKEKSSEIESFQTQLAHVMNKRIDLTPQITALQSQLDALGRQTEEKEREGEVLVVRRSMLV